MLISRSANKVVICILLFIFQFIIVSSSWARKPAYSDGYLDQYSMVPLDHFEPMPKQVKTEYAKLLKNKTEEQYRSFNSCVLKHLDSMCAVKVLLEQAFSTNKLGDLVADLEKLRGKVPPRGQTNWDTRLAYAYAYTYAKRRKVTEPKLFPISSDDVESLVRDIPKNRLDSRFVIADIAIGYDIKLARQVFEQVLSSRDKDYVLHTIVSTLYCFELGDIREYKGGKWLPIKGTGVPHDFSKAKSHLQKAIATNPKYAPAYYVLANIETDREKRKLYGRYYLEYEQDKNSQSYKNAKKALEKSP